jgi:predicted MFS family arabinose efflux permease
LGSVLGVPAGTLIGELAGWRMAFVVLGLLTLAVVAGLYFFVPPLPPLQVTRPAVLRDALRQRETTLALLLTCLIVTAHFSTYTYVTTFLREFLRPDLLSAFLLAYGVAGLVGNLVAGTTAGQHLRTTFLVCASLIAAATLLFPVLGRSTAGALVLLVVWGLGYGGVPVCSMSWFARAVPQASEAATVLFTSSFQAVLSAGAARRTGGRRVVGLDSDGLRRAVGVADHCRAAAGQSGHVASRLWLGLRRTGALGCWRYTRPPMVGWLAYGCRVGC